MVSLKPSKVSSKDLISKTTYKGQAWWLWPIILATWKVEIGRITV
jgi:hypothetical protein